MNPKVIISSSCTVLLEITTIIKSDYNRYRPRVIGGNHLATANDSRPACTCRGGQLMLNNVGIARIDLNILLIAAKSCNRTR